jgi:valyl-tRNA synthetase
MQKVYSPKEIEKKTYSHWEQRGFFSPKGEGPAYSIVSPPPNVTGILHMGHALNTTLQDIIVRYKRLTGHNVLWLPGTDHAGIATQNVVEKNLQLEGISRFDIGREKFIEKVWDWKEKYGNHITSQIRKLGASVDWKSERFTLDPGCVKAVKETFISLYNQNLIYRGSYIINWCPRCHTALSDIEVTHEETKGNIWDIRYPFTDDKNKYITIATTRPETMFGDTAIAVNPKDPRYKKLVGKTVTIPLTNKTIPIITDEHVEKDFGTGAVKVTPAHDINDFEMGRRHDLEQILIMDEQAIMNQNVPEQFQGLDRYDCRKKLLVELKEKEYLVETKDHALSIGHCYRCNTIVEPYLSKQWFVAMKGLATPAIKVVNENDIQFIPKRWEKLYFDWMENIRDWCISRQIWWGHRIPVWYCQDCKNDKPIVAAETPEACPNCKSANLKQDPDVLDTWFSSALWPFSTMGWPEKTDKLEKFYPTSLLITGYDILTFWVSRMITMGLAQTNEIPFDKVYIHGLVRDSGGKKMSKSIGNAIDPIELIDKYGADALRFSLASLSTTGGQDIKFSEEKIESSRNFANKVWNVSRYVMMNLENYEGEIDLDNIDFTQNISYRWIISIFNSTLQKLNSLYDSFNYALATEHLWDFIWNKYCDWFIEISKIERETSLPVSIFLLVNSLKMLHPVMPYITEEIWQLLRNTNKIKLSEESIMISKWPEVNETAINTEIETQMDTVIQLIREVRNLRSQLNIPPSKEVKLILVTTKKEHFDAINNAKAVILKLAKINDLELLENIQQKPKHCSSSVVQNISIYMPLDGLIDPKQEKARLNKQLGKIELEIAQNSKKLTNTAFLANAPAPVIDKIKNRQAELAANKQLLEKQIKQFS